MLLISTGIAIDQKDSEELLDASQIGSRSMDAFITDRLSEGSKISIFDPIKKLKLASFHSVSKKKVIKTKTKTVALQFSKDLFSKVAETVTCLSFGTPPIVFGRRRWHLKENDKVIIASQAR